MERPQLPPLGHLWVIIWLRWLIVLENGADTPSCEAFVYFSWVATYDRTGAERCFRFPAMGPLVPFKSEPVPPFSICTHFSGFLPQKGLNAELFPHAQGAVGMLESMTRCRPQHLRTMNKELGSSWVRSPDCGGGGINLVFPVLPPTAASRVAWSRGGQRTPRRKRPPSPRS